MAAEAMRCAEAEDKDGVMRQFMFTEQRRWGLSSSPREVWAKYAAAIGADLAKWRACLDAGTHRAAVEADRKLGLRMGVNATPTIFIGGRKMVGAVPYRQLAAAVRARLKR